MDETLGDALDDADTVAATLDDALGDGDGDSDCDGGVDETLGDALAVADAVTATLDDALGDGEGDGVAAGHTVRMTLFPASAKKMSPALPPTEVPTGVLSKAFLPTPSTHPPISDSGT